jgi:hypothetical protein
LRGPCRGDTLHKGQRLLDQLVALNRPMLHHAYPEAQSISPEVGAKINGITLGQTISR